MFLLVKSVKIEFLFFFAVLLPFMVNKDFQLIILFINFDTPEKLRIRRTAGRLAWRLPGAHSIGGKPGRHSGGAYNKPPARYSLIKSTVVSCGRSV